MEIVRRRYIIESPPFGSKIHPINVRIVDAYTGAVVGVVREQQARAGEGFRYVAECFFGGSVENPPEGWGDRFDLAADAVWTAYDQSLPGSVRVRRWVWRWVDLGWLLLGGLLGVVGSLVTKVVGDLL